MTLVGRVDELRRIEELLDADNLVPPGAVVMPGRCHGGDQIADDVLAWALGR